MQEIKAWKCKDGSIHDCEAAAALTEARILLCEAFISIDVHLSDETIDKILHHAVRFEDAISILTPFQRQ